MLLLDWETHCWAVAVGQGPDSQHCSRDLRWECDAAGEREPESLAESDMYFRASELHESKNMLRKQPAAKDKKASLVAGTSGTKRSHGEFIVCEPESGATVRSEVVASC